MKTYDFDPAEFAKLEFLLAHTFSFLHEKRGRAELDQFRAKFLPIIAMYIIRFWDPRSTIASMRQSLKLILGTRSCLRSGLSNS